MCAYACLLGIFGQIHLKIYIEALQFDMTLECDIRIWIHKMIASVHLQLHIETKAAVSANFPRPILHGLCTMAISVKHVLQIFAPGRVDAVQSVKVLLLDTGPCSMCG